MAHSDRGHPLVRKNQDDANRALHSHALDLQLPEGRGDSPAVVNVVIDGRPGVARIKSTYCEWDKGPGHQQMEITLSLVPTVEAE